MVFFRVYIFRAPIFPFCYLLWTWNHPAYYCIRPIQLLYSTISTYLWYTVPYLILKNEFYCNIGGLQAIFVPFIFMFKMSLLQGYFFLSKHFYPPPPRWGWRGGGLVLRTGWLILRLPPNHALCSPPTAKFNFLGEWNSITPQHESFRFFFCLKNQRYKIKEGFFYCYNRKWPKWNSSSLLRF